MSHINIPIGQLSTNALISHPQFGNAMKTFDIIQQYGEKHYQQMDKNKKYGIVNLMEGDDKVWWDSLPNKDETHEDIGWLIAHGFPFFAQHCKFPIYVAFDYSDKNRNGWYRLTTYYAQN